jgi:hypothetical protein
MTLLACVKHQSTTHECADYGGAVRADKFRPSSALGVISPGYLFG